MKRPARERCAADGSRLATDRRRARQSPPEKLHTVNASRRRRVYFSETTVMRGGTSSALISGYSTFLRLRSEGRCCWRGRSEVFGIWHARVERDARHEMMRRREEKRRSAVGGSDGKNAFPPTHRARRPSVRGPHRTPAFRKSPRAAGRGRVRPRFQVSGFWGSIRRRRTFLGLVLVWPLVALGLTCVAARTTRRTGAPIMTAMFRKCGVARKGRCSE